MRNWLIRTDTRNTKRLMRTKTLLLSAAVGAAGLLAASAQVYSVNSVGYINLTIPTAYSLISNQLKTTANKLSDILPAPPSGTKVIKWTGTGYSEYEFGDFGLGGAPFWAPDGNLVMAPGEGFFIRNPNPAPFTVTLVGEVPQAADSNITIPAGYSIRGSTVPLSGNLITTMGFPSALNDKILKWTGAGYSEFEYSDFGLGGAPFWAPSNPTVVVGEGFFVKKTVSIAWTRNFNVNL